MTDVNRKITVHVTTSQILSNLLCLFKWNEELQAEIAFILSQRTDVEKKRTYDNDKMIIRFTSLKVNNSKLYDIDKWHKVRNEIENEALLKYSSTSEILIYLLILFKWNDEIQAEIAFILAQRNDVKREKTYEKDKLIIKYSYLKK